MLPMPKVRQGKGLRIAFAGPMCSGKTFCAKYLERQYGFQRYALADSIKTLAYTYFATNGKTDNDRRVYQHIGASFRQIDPDVWIKTTLTKVDNAIKFNPNANIVVDDVRYVNEANIFAENGFAIIKLTVPDDIRNERIYKLYGKVSDKARKHPSETESAQIDALFTLESVNLDILWKLDSLYESLSLVNQK